jgi:alpha-galactosidase
MRTAGNQKKAGRTVSQETTGVTFYKGGTRETVRYVSGGAVHEEALENGRWIGLYWSATGHVHRENVTPNLPGLDSLRRPIHAFELEIDGQSLHNRWDLIGSSRRAGKRPGTTEAVVELNHQVRPVRVRVVTRLDGSPVLARYLEITNTGKAPAALSRVSPWSGVLWNTATDKPRHYSNLNPAFDETARSKFTLGYMAREDWGHEGDFVWQPLPQEHFRIERSEDTHHGSPYYILRNEATGEMMFLGLAWSGNVFAEFAYRHGALLSFRMGPLAPAPLRVIAAGETVTSPEVHLGPMHSSFDEAVGLWHRHMRASVIAPRPKGKEMYTVAGRMVEEPGEWLKREIDIAADMGAEAFMVDAGWHGETFAPYPANMGDWQEGDWLPGGMAGLRHYTHEKGMLFGLWHVPESIHQTSKLFREHPEWELRTDGDRELAPKWKLLNLAKPDVARHFTECIRKILKGCKPDFYKIDGAGWAYEGGQNLTDGFSENEYWRHYEVVYGAYDRIRQEFPEVCLENCRGGGGRNDIGMLSRFHYACESDWSVMPYSIRAINSMSLFIPPEAIVYYHNHLQHAHQTADLDTHLRVTLFAVPIYVGFGSQGTDRSSVYYAKARRYIGLHKGFCRPVLAGHPVVYHHTPDIGLFRPADWCVLEYAAPDRSRGYAGLFKLTGGPSEYRFRPRGVSADADYEVTLDNDSQTFRMSGRELALNGLPVSRDSALTSELVMYNRLGGRR